MASQYGTIHINQPLTKILIGYHPEGMIGDLVSPIVPVRKQSDKYKIYSKDNFRVDDYTRKSGSAAVEIIPMTVSDDTYYTLRKAVRQAITDEDMANADEPIKLKQHGVRRLKTKLMMEKEVNLATKLFNTTTFSGKTTALSGDDQWDANNGTTSYPIDAINTYKDTILKACGRKPNTLIVGEEVGTVLKTHPQLTNYMGVNQDKNVTYAKMAEAFGVKNFIVGEVPYNSAAEGLTASNTFVWGKYALLAYIAPTPMIDEPSLMYSFRWMMQNAGGNTMFTKSWREEKIESDMIEVNMNYDDKVISTDCGYLLSSVIS